MEGRQAGWLLTSCASHVNAGRRKQDLNEGTILKDGVRFVEAKV
jgi:hypothetical protein